MDIKPFTFEAFSEQTGAATALDTGKEFTSFTEKVAQDQAAEQGDAVEGMLHSGFSEEEFKELLKKTEEEAFAKGLEQGKQEAGKERLEVDAKVAESTARLVEMLNGLLAVRDKNVADISTASATMAVQIAKKVAGDMVDKNAAEIIENSVRKVVGVIASEPEVEIYLNDKMVAELEPKIKTIMREKGFKGKVIVTADKNLAEADSRVEWKDGSAETNLAEIWKKIQNTLTASNIETNIETGEEGGKETGVEADSGGESGGAGEEAKLEEGGEKKVEQPVTDETEPDKIEKPEEGSSDGDSENDDS